MAPKVISELLTKLDIHPVLIDIGSSGGPPVIWQEIAAHSVYVGFDPSREQTRELARNGFYNATIVNKAVTTEKGTDKVVFYATQSPSCSSTLRPDAASLSHYLFSDLFVVRQEETVRATWLDSVLDKLSLSRVDWFKTDSQGIDLRLFNSLSDPIRARVLAIDIEPGLIDAYVGEDLFVDAHRDLCRRGFWLSNLQVNGAVRLRKSTWRSFGNDDRYERLGTTLKKSPAWCEARYLRTIESLPCGDCNKAEYVLLWIFALLDNQVGFAADLTVAYESTFGRDTSSETMRDEVRQRLRPARRPILVAAATYLLPSRIRRQIRSYLRELLQ